jgi:hypothetical protein
MLHGVNIHSGYYTFRPEKILDYEQVPAMRIAAMGWRKVRYDFTPESLNLPDRGERWEKIEVPMPRLRLVTQSRVSQDMRKDILDIDVATTALTDTPIELERGSPGTATLIEDKPGRVTLQTQANTRQLLVFSESYHAGWKANIDQSTETEIILVYGDIMGCIIESGDHTVTLYFDPQSLATGKKLGLVGLLLLTLYSIIYGIRTRRPTQNQSA